MNYKSIIKKQTFIITVSIVVMAIILIGTSYALFINKDNSDTQVVSSGTLVISYTGSSITTVGGSDSTEIEPIDEATVDTQDPYIIKIKNTGTLAMKYNILIYTGDSNTLPHSYYAFKYKENGSYTQKAALTTLTKVDPSKTNMNEIKYKLTSQPFIINPDEEVTHELRVWLDEDYADEDSVDKIANIKIAVEGEATDPVERPKTVVEYISSIVDGNDTLVNDETEDNNLRYVGANPNNYVSFNNELWRIIGVMNNIETESGETKSLVKIIRADSLGKYSWDTSASEINSGFGVNEWSQADLMQELNNDYLGNVTIGTDGNWYSGSNNAKSTAKPISTISSEEQNKIESVKWNLGSPNNDNGTALTDYGDEKLKASYVYTKERSNLTGKVCTSGDYCNDTVTRTSSWTGKVALIYPSDYLYATAGGNTTNRTTCLNTQQYKWTYDASFSTNFGDCCNNDWIYISSSTNGKWSLSPGARNAYAVYGIHKGVSDGYASGSGSGASVSLLVHPVVFLKSSVSITGGEGTQVNPYTLGQ